MKTIKRLFVFQVIFMISMTIGCSMQSMVKKSIETIYKTSVDERSVGHILNDKKLSGLIMTELVKDDMTNLLDVTAECFFGYPFVVGECNNLEEAQRIMDIAQRITEKQPIPYLVKKGSVEDCNPALNLKISTEVKARLVADKKIFATNVVVKSVQCQVVLLGVLGSKESILAAIEHSEKVEGVKTVHSFLVSTDTDRSWDSVFKAMGKKAADKTDEAINGHGEDQKADGAGQGPRAPHETTTSPDVGKETIEPSSEESEPPVNTPLNPVDSGVTN